MFLCKKIVIGDSWQSAFSWYPARVTGYYFYRKRKGDLDMKTWLITGCSSGIGKGIAKAVLESGDQAVVTARKPETVKELVDQYPDTAVAVALDVCSQESIDEAEK